jgi:hypothetical protein
VSLLVAAEPLGCCHHLAQPLRRSSLQRCWIRLCPAGPSPALHVNEEIGRCLSSKFTTVASYCSRRRSTRRLPT